MIRARVAKNFDCNWDELIDGKAYKQRHSDEQLLLVFDKDDDVVEHNQSDVIQEVWPNAKVFKSRGLGHFKPLWAEEVVNQVTQFIADPLSKA